MRSLADTVQVQLCAMPLCKGATCGPTPWVRTIPPPAMPPARETSTAAGGGPPRIPHSALRAAQKVDVAGLHDELHAVTGSLARLQQLLPAHAAGATVSPATAHSAEAFEACAADLQHIAQATPTCSSARCCGPCSAPKGCRRAGPGAAARAGRAERCAAGGQAGGCGGAAEPARPPGGRVLAARAGRLLTRGSAEGRCRARCQTASSLGGGTAPSNLNLGPCNP